MSLLLSNRPVLNALGHYKDFAWAKLNSAISQLNSDLPSENQEEVVRIVVFMPNKFALDLHDHEVVTVEATHDARLPMLRECREFIRQINCPHSFHFLLAKDSVPHLRKAESNEYCAMLAASYRTRPSQRRSLA
jgi:hypothetical protein